MCVALLLLAGESDSDDEGLPASYIMHKQHHKQQAQLQQQGEAGSSSSVCPSAPAAGSSGRATAEQSTPLGTHTHPAAACTAPDGVSMAAATPAGAVASTATAVGGAVEAARKKGAASSGAASAGQGRVPSDADLPEDQASSSSSSLQLTASPHHAASRPAQHQLDSSAVSPSGQQQVGTQALQGSQQQIQQQQRQQQQGSFEAEGEAGQDRSSDAGAADGSSSSAAGSSYPGGRQGSSTQRTQVRDGSGVCQPQSWGLGKHRNVM